MFKTFRPTFYYLLKQSFPRLLIICGVFISLFPKFWASAVIFFSLSGIYVTITGWEDSSLSDSSLPAVDTKSFCDRMFVTRSGSLSFTLCNICGNTLSAIASISKEAQSAGVSC